MDRNILVYNQGISLYVNSVINELIPLLNSEDKDVLSKYLTRIIYSLTTFFAIDPTKIGSQLAQNNHQDTKWLILQLLPHLNTLEGLSSIASIYTAKVTNVNINKQEPRYVYSNLQYGRHIRGETHREYEYNEADIYHNYLLTLDTIRTMSNKMHVNWMDILPYTTLTYHKTPLFEATQKRFINNNYSDWDPAQDANMDISDDDFINRLNNQATGLYVGDIYNTLSLDLYESIHKIKWLLYDIIVGDDIVPMVVIISKLMGIRPILEGKNWDELDVNYRANIQRVWSGLINGSVSNKDMVLSPGAIKRITLSLLLGFDTRSKAVKYPGYKKLEGSIDFENYDQAIESINSIRIEHLYDFITNTIQDFKYTWYGTKLLTPDKKDIASDYYYLKSAVNTPPVTYKNVYNYAENIIHIYRGGKAIRMPEYWSSLERFQRQDIINRLNNSPTPWFNIRGNLTNIMNQQANDPNNWSQYFKLSNREDIMESIKNRIQEKLPNIIFESLIFKGVLTRFIPNREKTDKSIISRSDVWSKQKDVMRDSQDNEYWTSAYHTLMRLPYCHMPEFTIKRGTFNHFSFGTASKGNAWYSLYAYDWISQLGFCHHYLNGRVQFITGSTGVGKSTEIPKLFLYNTVALDYRNNARIVCTQTRRSATGRNAEWVATTLGVPIITTDNIVHHHYIQMRHGEESEKYYKRNARHPVLEYITDGLLYTEMKMPAGLMDDSTENLYDIYLIDEAHEHNPNIDIILTLLKTNLTYNNSIKLVIVSATMDEDEPRYRRFYRDINDNKKYPPNVWIRDNVVDRVNVDRRYHISPPGVGTNFPVEEIYRPGWDVYMAVNHIISTSAEGDILVFQPGEAEISEVVDNLNQTLPFDVVAVPYHGKMEQEVREVIEGISERLSEVKMDRASIKGLSGTTLDQLHNGSNVYRRAVIVATNAAEASITIESLKFVVDTGTQKTSFYDYRRNLTLLDVVDISESSRVQRKGRVGRKSSGTAYFLYEQGKMANNKTFFAICSMDLSGTLFKQLKTRNEKTFALSNNNPDDPSITLRLETFKDNRILTEFLKKNYFTNGYYYTYYGNFPMYDYDRYPNFKKYYQTGFHAATLMDSRGEFYLVHPEELYLVRNIIGAIEGVTLEAKDIAYRSSKEINSEKMQKFWEISQRYMYVINIDGKYHKTPIGLMIEKYQASMAKVIPDGNLVRLLFYSAVFGVRKKIGKLVALSLVTRQKPLSVFKQDSILLKNEYRSDIEGVVDAINDYPKDESQREGWCESNGLRYDVMKDYYEKYLELAVIFLKSDKEIYTYADEIRERLGEYRFLDNPDELVSLALIFAYPNNIYKRIKNSTHYISVPDKSLLSMCSVVKKSKKDRQGNFQLNRLVSDNYLGEYVLATDFDIKNNVISGLHYVTPAIVAKYNILYEEDLFKHYEADEESVVKVKQIVETTYNEKKFHEKGCPKNPRQEGCNFKEIYTNAVNAISGYKSEIEHIRSTFTGVIDKYQNLVEVLGLEN